MATIGAQAFISYTRADNTDHLDVVDRLSAELSGRFGAATGRSLEVFVDREGIGWGDDWRTKIRDSVQAATFFIPVITMRYFQSDACREELLAFYENAKQLGVTELIMPIVLAGSNFISKDDPRPEVRLIESLNYKNIQEAWLSGYSSPDWLRAVNWMVEQLASALSRAEAALDERGMAEGAQSPSDDAKEAVHTQAEAQPVGDVIELTARVSSLKPLMERAMSDMSDFANAANSTLQGKDLKSMPPKQQQLELVSLARKLTGPSERFAASSAALEAEALETDAILRATVDELRSIDGDMAKEQVATLLRPLTGMQALTSSVHQMDEFVQVLRFAAVTNVSLRKALGPAIKGVQSVSSSLEVFDSWRSL